jgi:hypothetical protein
VGLTQLVRFLVVELAHSGLNPKFDISVAFTTNYSFSEWRRLHRQRCALGDQLHELKIKPGQSFGGAHRGRICVHVFIWASDRTYISIYVCTVFLKKIV